MAEANEKEVDRFIDRLAEILLMQVEAEAAASTDQIAAVCKTGPSTKGVEVDSALAPSCGVRSSHTASSTS